MACLDNLLCEQVLQFPMALQAPFDCCRIDGERIPLNLRNGHVKVNAAIDIRGLA